MRNDTEGTYGITWATTDHPIAQTGYDFATVEAATEAAERGPRRTERSGVPVDPMCEHRHRFRELGMGKLYGRIETEQDSVTEVRVR